MTDVAALIADMIRSGVDPDLIGRTAQALSERPAVLVPDASAELRRAKDRERKALRKSAEVGGRPAPSSPEVFPQTPFPNPTNPIPPSPPKGGSSPAGFDAFWAVFPNKVGKADAIRAFARAARRVDLETMMAGLRRYVGKTDDRPWCNPATWLNQGRWEDEPAAPVARAGPPPARSGGLGSMFGQMREHLENGQGNGSGGDRPPGAPVLSLSHRRAG